MSGLCLLCGGSFTHSIYLSEAPPQRDPQFRQPEPGLFTSVHGDALPLLPPNVRPGFEEEDIANAVNASSGAVPGECGTTGLCCALTGFGACYILCCKTHLIEQGRLGFARDNGTPKIIRPGWAFLPSPFTSMERIVSLSDLQSRDYIEIFPVTIVRVQIGSLGFGELSSKVVILLPGVHVFNSGVFKFRAVYDATVDKIEQGPIKIFTVKSGTVQVCNFNGAVNIFREGRYAINTQSSFQIGHAISVAQQNLEFNRHKVMLNGGVQVFIQGLLTYRVVHVEKLILTIGVAEVKSAIERTCEAEISRVFSTIHLEQIASSVIFLVFAPLTYLLFRHAREGRSRQRSTVLSVVVIRPRRGGGSLLHLPSSHVRSYAADRALGHQSDCVPDKLNSVCR